MTQLLQSRAVVCTTSYKAGVTAVKERLSYTFLFTRQSHQQQFTPGLI